MIDPEIIKQLMASFGARGGKARAANRSKKELSEIGKKGASVRWKGHKKKVKRKASGNS